MRIEAAFALVLVSSACVAAAPTLEPSVPLRDVPMPPVEQRFPVTYNAAAVNQAYAAPDREDGENAAVEGEIVSVQKLQNGLPAITLRLAKDLTIVLLHSTSLDGSSFLEPGLRLRAMGYLRKTQDMVSLLGPGAANPNPLSLMSLCIVQSENLAGAFDQRYIELCAAWQKGKKLERLK